MSLILRSKIPMALITLPNKTNNIGYNICRNNIVGNIVNPNDIEYEEMCSKIQALGISKFDINNPEYEFAKKYTYTSENINKIIKEMNNDYKYSCCGNGCNDC